MHLWGCWNVLSGREKQSFIFTFILVSLSVQECLSFENKHPLSSSERCVLLGCTRGPAARASALPGSPSSHPASRHLQSLFQRVSGCRVFWPGLRYVLSCPQLFFWHGSCWGCQECGWGFLCLPNSSFLLADDLQMLSCFLKCSYQRNPGEREGTWRDKCYISTYWLPDLTAERKKLKNLSP